jgi:hypothetical protein
MKLPFFKSTMQKIETTITALTKRGAQLDAQRCAAQAALDKATKARQDALIGVDDLDDQKLTKLQRAVSDAVSLLQGIDEAIGILTQEKAQAEAKLAAEKDRVARDVAAEQLTSKVSAIEAGLGPWLEQSRIWSDALSELAHWHFGCSEMSQFLQSCMGQMETAANFQLAELKAMPQFIRDGRQNIPAEKKPAPVVKLEPPPPTMTVFMTRSARFRDHDGKKRFAGQYDDVIMPVATAQKAMRLGLAVTTADPIRATHRGARGNDYRADGIDVVDIDEAVEHSGIPFIGPNDEPAMERSARIDPVTGVEFVEFCGPARVGLAKVS